VSLLVAPIWPCVAGGQKGQGCLFRTLFLWLLFFGGAKESNKHESNKHENNKKERDGASFETPSLFQHSWQLFCSISIIYIVLYFLLTLKESTKEKAPKKSKLMALLTRNADAAGA